MEWKVMNVKRFVIPGAAIAASLALAACGGGSSSESSAGGGEAVGVKSVDGVGDVLVDSSGKALYASDVETGGKVRCVDACESFWKPLTVASATPTAASATVGRLAVIRRPDGTRQVAIAGMPLYTFADDSAGQIKGIGFEDDFNGRHFTWNAVLAGGGLATRSGGDSSGDSSGGGYGS
jgi:predicted lipoprotein with Yx(FWY)xxD motif